MTSQGPPPEVADKELLELARGYVGSRGTGVSDDQIRAAVQSQLEGAEPEGLFSTAVKWLNRPLEFTTQLAAQAFAPDELKDRYAIGRFSPTLAQQKTMFNLLRESQGRGGQQLGAADAIGVLLDIALDPMFLTQFGKARTLTKALESARAFAGSPEAAAKLLSNLRLGIDAIETTDEFLAKAPAAQVARIRKLNAILKEEAAKLSDGDAAKLVGSLAATPRSTAEANALAAPFDEGVQSFLKGPKPGLRGVAEGQRRLASIPGLDVELVPGARKIAGAAVSAADQLKEKFASTSVGQALRKAFVARPLLPVLDELWEKLRLAEPNTQRRIIEEHLANAGQLGNFTRDELLEVMDLQENRLEHVPVDVLSARQEVRDWINSDRFEAVMGQIKNSPLKAPPKQVSAEAERYVRPKTLSGDELEKLSATAPGLPETIVDNARIRVYQPVGEELMRSRQAMRELKDIPGLGNWGSTRDGRTFTKTVAPIETSPSAMEHSHATNLDKTLALAAQRGWGVDPARGIGAADIVLGPDGMVQITNPGIFSAYGTTSSGVANAVAASRSALTRFVAKISPEFSVAGSTLDDVRKAMRVRPEWVRPARIDESVTIEALRGAKSETQAILPIDVARGDFINYDPIPSAQSGRMAERFKATGRVRPVEVVFDPLSGQPWIRNQESVEALKAAESLGFKEVPVVIKSWVGEDVTKIPAAYASKEERELAQANARKNLTIPRHATPDVLVPNMNELRYADDAKSLRLAGFTDQEALALSSGTWVNADGKAVLNLRIVADELRTDIEALPRRLRAALIDTYGAKGEGIAKDLIAKIFPALPSGQLGLDLEALSQVPVFAGRGKLDSTIKKIAADLRGKTEVVKRFLQTGDPASLGQPRGALFKLAPRGDRVLIGAVGQSGFGSLEQEAAAVSAAARYAASKGVDPATVLVPVRGSGTTATIDQFVDKVGQIPRAIDTLEVNQLTSDLVALKTKRPFQIGAADAEALKQQGIHVETKGIIPHRIKDDQIWSFIVGRGGKVILGENIRETKTIKSAVFGLLPDTSREFGYVVQGRARVYNLTGQPIEEITSQSADLMTQRLKDIAAELRDANVPGHWELDVKNGLGIAPDYADQLFGPRKLTLDDVLAKDWKVKVPPELEGRQLDPYQVATNIRVTMREGSTPKIQAAANWYRDRIGGKVADEEIKAGLMLPDRYIEGYYARVLTPEGRKAIDDWFEAVMQQNGGAGSVLNSYRNSHMKGRKLTDLTTAEINDLFRYGEENGYSRSKLLKVKIDAPGFKGKVTIADMLNQSPEDLAFFVEDFRISALHREMASQRSILRKEFIDGALDATGKAIGPNGETWLSTKEFRRILNEPATEEERRVSVLLKELTNSGSHSAVMDATEVRNLVRKGALDPSYLDKLKSSWMVPIDGKLLEAEGKVRFIRKDAIDEMNRLFDIVESPRSSYKLVRAFDKVQNVWKQYTLFPVPKFHLRNVVSNLILNWGGGLAPLDIFNPSGSYHTSWRIYHGYKGWRPVFEDEAARGIKGWLPRSPGAEPRSINGVLFPPSQLHVNQAGQALAGGELMEQALRQGVIGGGPVVREFAANEQIAGEFRKQLKKQGIQLLGEDDRSILLNNVIVDGGRRIHMDTENAFRFAVFYDAWQKGATVEEAAMNAKKVMGGATDLTGFERKTLARVFPFYRWLKFNVPRQLEWLTEHPDQVYKMIRATEAIMRGDIDVPQEAIPDYIKRSYGVHLGKNPDGTYSWFSLEGVLPFTDLLRFASLGTDLAHGDLSAADAIGKLGTSPLITRPLEQIFNKSLYSGQALEDFPGQPSERMRGSTGFTKRATTQGPLGVLNLLANDPTLDLIRPVKETSQFLQLMHQAPASEKERWLGFLLGRVNSYSPERVLYYANVDRQRQFSVMKAALRRSIDKKDVAAESFIRRQMAKLELLQDG